MNRKFGIALVVILGIAIGVALFTKSPNNVEDNSLDWAQRQNTPSAPETDSGPEVDDVGPKVPSNPTNYSEALAKAKAENKELFLYFYSDNCTYCEKMKNNTLSDASVKTLLSKYVVYHVDTIAERNVAAKYRVRWVPYYVVINPNNEVVKKSGKGYRSPQTFKAWLDGNFEN